MCRRYGEDLEPNGKHSYQTKEPFMKRNVADIVKLELYVGDEKQAQGQQLDNSMLFTPVDSDSQMTTPAGDSLDYLSS